MSLPVLESQEKVIFLLSFGNSTRPSSVCSLLLRNQASQPHSNDMLCIPSLALQFSLGLIMMIFVYSITEESLISSKYLSLSLTSPPSSSPQPHPELLCLKKMTQPRALCLMRVGAFTPESTGAAQLPSLVRTQDDSWKPWSFRPFPWRKEFVLHVSTLMNYYCNNLFSSVSYMELRCSSIFFGSWYFFTNLEDSKIQFSEQVFFWDPPHGQRLPSPGSTTASIPIVLSAHTSIFEITPPLWGYLYRTDQCVHKAYPEGKCILMSVCCLLKTYHLFAGSEPLCHPLLIDGATSVLSD